MKPQDTTTATLKKLILTKETLRQLTAPELQLAVGGDRPICTKDWSTCGTASTMRTC